VLTLDSKTVCIVVLWSSRWD